MAPLSGERYSARLAALAADGAFEFESAGKTSRLAPEELVQFGAFVDSARGPLVVLADGGTLAADSLEGLTSQWLAVDSGLWGEIRLPLGLVRGVVFRPPADPLARDKLLLKVQNMAGDEDQLLFDNGDLLTGQLKSEPPVQGPEAPGAQHQGLAALRLETKAGQASVSVEKLLALVFNPALVEAPRGRLAPTWFGFRDGSRLAATHATSNENKVRLTIAGGLTLSADRADWLDEVVAVQPLAARAAYLSDLPAAGYKHIPFLGPAWDYGSNANLLGGKLRSGGSIYLKGLSMHSAARLAYALEGRFRRFEADLALDHSAGTRGSVVYRVFVEREPGEWQAAYESPVVRGGDAPLPISINVSGGRRLALIVEYADRGDELDHANWLNARLVK